MALAGTAARRYAEAVFEIAERDDSMEAWSAALTVAQDRLTDPQVMRLLANPAIGAQARIDVLERIVGDSVSGPQRNLLALMVRRGRIELLPSVIREFRRLYRRREGIAEATVVSAAALDESELTRLQEQLAEITGKRIELRHAVDPTLLGGLQVRVGDQLIDGSVRGRLERLRTRFSNIAI